MAQPRKLHDRYFKQAKAEGYLARSAYKLLEINERRRLIRRADAVLDLGCAPGSWMQVAAELAGDEGLVVGVDLLEVRHVFPPNVVHFVGDAFKVTAEELLARSAAVLGARPGAPAPAEPQDRLAFDVVISDMAPNTTGYGDDFLSVRLCRRVLDLLPAVLRRGGHMTMKVFEGEEYPTLVRETQAVFREARGFKPKASREVSREMYIIAHGYRG
jgi:23S rRNA (uridine2552-2'-O)-methyltransferase